MNNKYIIPDEWAIIEKEFDKEKVSASESLFSMGNGYMGQRANFEESYTGESLQGSYIGGIYYPDKTRVGWWKNGYPEYFAKVLNAPNWIGINVMLNGQMLDLNTCKVENFYRKLNMKEGWLKRSFIAIMPNGEKISVESTRFLSFDLKEVGVIQYQIEALNFEGSVVLIPYLDGGIVNEDANYDEFFWKILEVNEDYNEAFILSETLKTKFGVCTGMKSVLYLNGKKQALTPKTKIFEKKIEHHYSFQLKQNDKVSIHKFAGYTQSMNHPTKELQSVMQQVLDKATMLGFEKLLKLQVNYWKDIWETSDIKIEGDLLAQQAIRFNIFQLNQTYTGKDARLNIGPKGFTGEKYGGSTYWDTEAYCIPFYLSTKSKNIAKNLLIYRYNHLEKAIENAAKLGFKNGAALYPMVTMNGEECHNEWEITFEEIHRNGAIIYAIYNYVNYTGDYSYITEYGLEVMIAVARFWAQRVNYSQAKKAYVMLGVTGPNEYENNVHNNWYTNYIAKWCLTYTAENITKVKEESPDDFHRIIKKTNWHQNEMLKWQEIAENMFFPKDKERPLFLQQCGFLDKEIIPTNELPASERPINQNWSWDRILRSCYIKQADVLQGMYFFENHFDTETIKNHFDFYEPLTVHESSLSPCVYSIVASKIDNIDKAYELYLRTARLDLDDYNNEVDEGLHITSMAGTWLSVIQGFGGMRNYNDELSFNPIIPKEWTSYAFKVKYRGAILEIYKSHKEVKITNLSDKKITLLLNGEKLNV